MSKKDSPHKKKTVFSSIKASRDIDGLSAVFLSAFGEVLNAQIHHAQSLKKTLIDTDDDLEKYQVWREVQALSDELSLYNDGRLDMVSEAGTDLISLKNAYIPPDDLDEKQRLLWHSNGASFVARAIPPNTIDELSKVNESINDLLRSNSAINKKIERLESEYISPLVEKARSVIGEIKEKGESEALMSEYDMFRSAIESAHRTKIDPALQASGASLDPASKANLESLKEKKKQIGTEMMSSLYDALLDQSVISDDEASLWSSKQEITTSAIARMKKSGYTESQVRRDMATYYKLTNGRIDKVRLITTGSKRASAIINTATIDIDNNFDRSTLFHEMSHLLEADASVKMANQRFIKKRASGSPQKLSELTKNPLYKNDEIAIPDNFYSPYVGKIYTSGATEVASMGVQQFSSLESMYALYESDEEMFTLMVGMMTSMNDTLQQRQKRQLDRQVSGDHFMQSVKRISSQLSWQDGHRMSSDELWDQALSGKSKVDAHNRKWGWKRSLGSCELLPAKAARQRGQIFCVIVHGEGESKRQFFKRRLQAEVFAYIHELSSRGIKPLAQNAFYLACNNLAPDWYQSDTELPLI